MAFPFRLAGRAADIASMIPRQDTGEWSVPASLADSTMDRMVEKAAWVREGATGAGRDPAAVELNTMVFKVAVCPDVAARRRALALEAGVTESALADSTLFLTGTAPEVRARLLEYRQRVGLSYFSLFDPGDAQIDYLAEHVVQPLVSGAS